MEIQFQPASKRSKQYRAVRSLYHRAFPSDERAPFWLLMRRSKCENVDFLEIYDGQIWVGLLYVIHDADLSYVFYFAIRDGMRGKGYGSATLAAIKRRYAGRRVFLAIEQLDPAAENYMERVKRKQFYQNSGLKELGCQLREASVVYDLLGIGGIVKPEEYAHMMRRYLGWLMSRLIPMQILPNK